MKTPHNNSVTKGTIWSAVDKFGIVALQFIINLVMARLLTPYDFGLVGMILIIVAVSTILIDGGFGAALIQKSNADERDFSTTFYINIIAAAVLYALIFLAAPYVATFLGNPIFERLLKVISLVLIINSVGVVPKTKLRKAFAFKQIAIANLVSYTMAAVIAIVIAWMEYGYWGLIAIHIVNSIFSSLLLWLFARWHPTKQFSLKALKQLFKYGEYILISDILSNACFHIQSTLIGKYFAPATAGQYSQAKKMEEVASITLPNAMVQVLFPLFSEMQDNNDTLLSSLRLSNKITAFIIFPILTLLIIIAEPIILFLFGSNWAGAIHYFQVLCIGGYFGALQYFTYFAVAATGQSKALFYAGIIKSIFLLGAIFVTAHISMEAVLLAMVLSNVVNYLTNGVIAAKHVGYKMLRQMGDVAPILLISLLIGTITLGVDHLWNIHWALLSLIYLLLYLAIATLSHNEIVSLVLAKCRR